MFTMFPPGFSGGSDGMVKNLPTIRETWVRSLGWEDPLEESMATQLQYAHLEKPTNRGAWWAMVHSVAKSWRQLK